MIDRRSFLRHAAAAAAAVPFHALLARADVLAQSGDLRALRTSGYGPLVDALDEATGLPLLKLPEGFRYVTFGWAGDVMERLVDREPMINSVTVGYGYCNTFQFSSEKAKRELGYQISPLEPAIADALSWFRQHGMV